MSGYARGRAGASKASRCRAVSSRKPFPPELLVCRSPALHSEAVDLSLPRLGACAAARPGSGRRRVSAATRRRTSRTHTGRGVLGGWCSRCRAARGAAPLRARHGGPPLVLVGGGRARLRRSARGRLLLRHGALGSRAQRLGQSLRRRTVGPAGCPAAPRRPPSPPLGLCPRPASRDSSTPWRRSIAMPGRRHNAVRLQAYADTMARLHRDLPRDTEVTIYHALALVATAPRTDTTFAQQRRAVALLDPLYQHYPDHPGLAHYIIHSTDSPRLAADGLAAARRYARIAPAAPHAQHMPSHIFVRLGLWDETVSVQLAVLQRGIAHARATSGTPPPRTHELHALDYAVYGYLQRGQDSAARQAVATGQALEVLPAQSALVAANTTGPPWRRACRSSAETGRRRPRFPRRPTSGHRRRRDAEPLHPGGGRRAQWSRRRREAGGLGPRRSRSRSGGAAGDLLVADRRASSATPRPPGFASRRAIPPEAWPSRPRRRIARRSPTSTRSRPPSCYRRESSRATCSSPRAPRRGAELPTAPHWLASRAGPGACLAPPGPPSCRRPGRGSTGITPRTSRR